MQTLLLIDDEAGIRFTIREVLQGPDLRVLAAENSAEGLQLAREESPDVVLLDIRLGNESGLDVFHGLREIDPKVLVVFITGSRAPRIPARRRRRCRWLTLHPCPSAR